MTTIFSWTNPFKRKKSMFSSKINATIHKALTLMLVFLSVTVQAQETAISTSPISNFNKGLELYQKGMYVPAQKFFENFIASKEQSGRNQLISDAYYYRAMCAIELNNNDAEFLVGEFIQRFPESKNIDMAYFSLGKILYQTRKYVTAKYWLLKVDKNGIDKDTDYERMFMLGYCMFMNIEYDDAAQWFYRVKDVENKFASPSTYYYSYIAYFRKNYATALKGFEKLKNDPTFSPIIPYYIVQIYYLQNDFESVTKFGVTLANDSITKRGPEIARLVGDAYFKLKKYDSSIVYLNKYVDSKPKLTRNDYYLIGFAQYKTGNYSEAASYLERVATSEDSLSQNAYYHLADSYLKLNDKNKARQAFGMASRLNFDTIIQEDALFNFAKLTYEQLYAPFDEAIDAFKQYIKLYPNSPRTDEAYNYLTLAYLSTKNYNNAVETLEKIKNKDVTIKTALQKAAYFRALELFQNLKFAESIDMFSRSLAYPENPTLTAMATYWQAEAYYRTNDFENAAQGYQNFILTPGAFNLNEYLLAHYNLGYAYFKIKKYDDAIVWFRKFTNLSQNDTTKFVGDAYNRIGDSFFIQRRYWAAIDYYDKAVEIGTIDADYALFQRGFSLGLVDRPEKKIESLKRLLATFPNSDYTDDAIFEIAESEVVINKIPDAKQNYKLIEKNYPSSSYYLKSLVQLGLLYYNTENPDSALIYYKRVVEAFPNSPEANNALLGIRNIYVDNGDANAYFNYASKLGKNTTISVNEKDSLSYIAAEKTYVSGDFAKAISALNEYITTYPQGNFALNANYYLAESYFNSNDTTQALELYTKVSALPKNNFTEPSLLKMGKILYSLKRYSESYDAYTKLESIAEYKSFLFAARIGRLRCAYELEKYEEIPSIAASILSTEKIADELERETRFKLAKSLLKLNKEDDALVEFSKVAQNLKTLEGAESKYMKVKIYFDKGEYSRAETEVFNFAEKNTPHQYWLAKSFILLSDVYAKQNDFFQAKATLQSVIDGYKNTDDGIIDEASEKLTELVKEEKLRQKPDSTINE
ncbi:MAG: tetratricopeptide repeat protein [Bacteroidales bacterium]|nr:tetratricopeptide repeat protein [Bacteroidales bacterium]